MYLFSSSWTFVARAGGSVSICIYHIKWMPHENRDSLTREQLCPIYLNTIFIYKLKATVIWQVFLQLLLPVVATAAGIVAAAVTKNVECFDRHCFILLYLLIASWMKFSLFIITRRFHSSLYWKCYQKKHFAVNEVERDTCHSKIGQYIWSDATVHYFSSRE